MDKKLYLSFLWHMHQPYYKDDIKNETLMPWVFLHAIKDYYEMPWYLSHFPKLKATFNLVPSLLYQLQQYAEDRANDRLLNAIKKDFHSQSDEDKNLLSSYLFLANEKNMIQPLERYYELYQKYQKENSRIDNFSYQELIDAKVLFLLSWCGNYLRENNNTIKYLLDRQRDYTTTEKALLIKTLSHFIFIIIEYYSLLEQSGQIAISTTPFYHPITPLLIDFNSAIEARGDVMLPNVKFSLAPYASLHTKHAIKYFKNRFKKKPKGFWPAEGSVSQKTANIFKANGIEWFATDEDILFKTLNSKNRENLYKNYKLKTRYGVIDVRFRDRLLSDAIGFEYSQIDAKYAATTFVKHLKNIFNSSKDSPLVNIILDGENAWEFYKNNAKDFFMELYKLINQENFIECVTMDEISSLPIEHQEIDHIATGSWINGNFDIWIGSSEKNKAWELIELTYNTIMKNHNSISKEDKLKIAQELMISQSSDWFWWYGDDHYTIQKEEFDSLFRTHLINIFNMLKLPIPKDLITPIVKKSNELNFNIKPTDYISPFIDGNGYFFEWLNSGRVDTQKEFGAMDSKKSIIEKFNYGYDDEYLYFLFNGDFEKYNNLKFIFKFDDNESNVKVPFKDSFLINNEQTIKIYHSNSIEVKINKSLFKNKEKIKFSFRLLNDEDIMQFFPIYSDFKIEFENLKLKYWFI